MRRRKARLHRRTALRRGFLERRSEALVAAREHEVVNGHPTNFSVRHHPEAILQQVGHQRRQRAHWDTVWNRSDNRVALGIDPLRQANEAIQRCKERLPDQPPQRKPKKS